MSLLEERFELGPRRRRLACSLTATPVARGEILAMIRPLAIPHPLAARLATFVVSARIVVLAVPAAVEIGTAGITHLAKAHSLARCQLRRRVACRTSHGSTTLAP